MIEMIVFFKSISLSVARLPRILHITLVVLWLHSQGVSATPEVLLGTFETPKEAIFAEGHTELKTSEFMGLLSFEIKLRSRKDLRNPRGKVIDGWDGVPLIASGALFIPCVSKKIQSSTPPETKDSMLYIRHFHSYAEGGNVLIGTPETIGRVTQGKPVRPSDVLIRSKPMPKSGMDPMNAKPGPIPSIHQFQNVKWSVYAKEGGQVYPLRKNRVGQGQSESKGREGDVSQ